MSEWQSIETAPKGGRYILLWPKTREESVTVARWMRGLWEDAFGCGYRSSSFTHWMPVPDGPGALPTNAHAEMVESLRQLASLLETLSSPNTPPATSSQVLWAQCVEVSRRARGALAKAQGLAGEMVRGEG